MKLEKIIVKGLFGVFNHEIVLKEHITILVSENGYGKTVILSMLYAFFEFNFLFFLNVVFDELILVFYDGNIVKIGKDRRNNIYVNDKMIFDYEKVHQEVYNGFSEVLVNSKSEEITPKGLYAFITTSDTTIHERYRKMIETNITNLKLETILYQSEKEKLLLTPTYRVDGIFNIITLYKRDKIPKKTDYVDFFIKTINSYLLHKKLSIRDDIFIITSTLNQDNILINDLSSGEKHIFTIFYDLIFEAQEGSFVLLDEPEISLHISWQNKFIRTLQEIVALKPLNILIATHSPNIIDTHWKMVTELNEPISI